MRAADHADDLADTARTADHLADMSASSRRAIPLSPADDPIDFARLGPCPIRLMPKCVAAGTLIATPDGGSKPIEELRVGDRVATTNVTRAVPDGTTTVDPLNWHLVTLLMSNPADAGDVYEIQTLRPLDWILEHASRA